MNYSIAVWDIQLYKINQFGEPLTDSEGNVKLFDAPDFDCSYIAEGIDDCGLRLVEVTA